MNRYMHVSQSLKPLCSAKEVRHQRQLTIQFQFYKAQEKAKLTFGIKIRLVVVSNRLKLERDVKELSRVMDMFYILIGSIKIHQHLLSCTFKIYVFYYTYFYLNFKVHLQKTMVTLFPSVTLSPTSFEAVPCVHMDTAQIHQPRVI
jgi:hypothetical protein